MHKSPVTAERQNGVVTQKKEVHLEHLKYRGSVVTSARGYQGSSQNSILTCTYRPTNRRPNIQAHKQKTYPLLEVVIGLVRYLRNDHQGS